jgi:hypothetical protein
MNHTTLMKGALLAFCIIGMIVLPAAAAPSGQSAKTPVVDQALKADLWASHHTYRLQEFDSHVAQANNVIAILGKYSIDTTQEQATLASISSQRSALDTALTGKDTASLKTINANLASLWKQFGQETRDAVKAHAAAARAAAKAAKTGSAGTVTSPVVTPSAPSATV